MRVSGVALLLAALACTSNDTLFIQLTPTPVPTVTPTAAALISSRYRAGETLTFVAQPSPGTLAENAGSASGGALCFTGTQVTVLQVAGSATAYQIRCASAVGWAREANLTALVIGGRANVQAETFVTDDPEPDTTTNRADSASCKANAATSILDLATSGGVIYANVQCGAAVGWLPEAALKAATP